MGSLDVQFAAGSASHFIDKAMETQKEEAGWSRPLSKSEPRAEPAGSLHLHRPSHSLRPSTDPECM